MGYGEISSFEIIPNNSEQYINVDVIVDVFIFSPPVGSILEGYY